MKREAIRRWFFGFVLTALLLTTQAVAQYREPKQTDKIQYCDLMQDPQKYDGKRVSVRAVYSYGFEWQELLCMECRGKGRTWLDWGLDADDRVRKDLKKAPRHQGVVIASFTGIFHARGGPYGDGGYKYSFDLYGASDLKVLARDMKTPISKVGMCGNSTNR